VIGEGMEEGKILVVGLPSISRVRESTSYSFGSEDINVCFDDCGL
jgi:hypothetical protein